MRKAKIIKEALPEQSVHNNSGELIDNESVDYKFVGVLNKIESEIRTLRTKYDSNILDKLCNLQNQIDQIKIDMEDFKKQIRDELRWAIDDCKFDLRREIT